MTITVPETQPTMLDQYVDGLRRFADFVEANPDLVEHLRYMLDDITIIHGGGGRQYMAQFARAAARAGLEVAKDYVSDKYAYLNIMFSPVVGIKVAAGRDEVCERVVTGSTEVVKEVPDPELLAAVPKVIVTEVVETFEWKCRPLLADAESAGVQA